MSPEQSSVRNSLREDLMEIETTPEEQAVNELCVTNGMQFSDGSIEAYFPLSKCQCSLQDQ